jgi:hypothetical protein
VTTLWNIKIAGFGDFSGDGKQDILWRNKNSGAVYVWVMSGFSVASVWYGGAPGLDWKIVGTPALTGGKFSDVLWANTTTGSIGVWWGSSTGLVPGPTFSSVGAGWSPMPAQQ